MGNTKRPTYNIYVVKFETALIGNMAERKFV